MTSKKTAKSHDSIYLLAKKAAEAALNKKASDIIILTLKDLTSVADYFVICTGDVDMHVKAIADEIKKELKHDIKPWHIEGYQHLRWVLIDFVDFVVHVFHKDTRDYYNIERLWADAPLEKLVAPAADTQDSPA
ncbi:ribosome silencing factor [bacterium]|nr:ribosome silencing factor [bacterium]MBU1064293.1 ribosome silencing factor [bacterium]MBU1635141.1 ribosome silencing factor [bacterium]MBU1875162.1 ribosome silencing factor [bacterium]